MTSVVCSVFLDYGVVIQQLFKILTFVNCLHGHNFNIIHPFQSMVLKINAFKQNVILGQML